MSTIPSFGTLVETIKQQYELPEILSLEAIPSPRSNTADAEAVYRIFTSKDSYVLRRYRTDSIDAIASHNYFLNWAERNSYQLSQRIIRTRAEADVFEFQNHRWWLALYVEADESFQWTQPDWNVDVCLEAGKALAELHLLLQEFGKNIQPAQLNYWMNEPSVVLNVEAKLSQSLSDSKLFLDKRANLQALLRGALATINPESAATSISTTSTNLNEQSELNRAHQLVHGDFHPGNVLLRDGKSVAIIDFEYLHFEESIYDVAYALVMFCSKWSDADDGKLEPAFIEAFVRGYLERGLVLDPELLYAYMVVAASVNLSWLLERPSDRSKAVHFVNLLSQMENFSTISFSL